MRPSLRKFIGMVVLLSFVIVYLFIVMVIGDMKLQQASTATRLLYFAVTGLIWILPAGLIIRWMQKGDILHPPRS